jgi:hypothetical protein
VEEVLMRHARSSWSLLVVVLLVGLGCSVEAQEAEISQIRFYDADETLLCKIKSKNGDHKVYDGADKVLGKITVSEDRVKLSDDAGTVLIKVKRKDYGAEIEDGAGNRLYKLKLGDDGSWKLRDGSDTTIFKCKLKSDGYEVRRASGETVAKVKVREGKLGFKTEDGEELFKIKGVTDARAGMWFAVEGLSMAERAAVFVFFLGVYR